MYLKSLELSGFKSFAKKSRFEFGSAISAIVGPNGSGKSNIAEAFRFALGEQSMKSLRGKRGEDLIWSGSDEVPRANRAGVKLVFDNTKRLFDIDFDEVVIERVVHRDGANTYLINDSPVRLRDVLELLAGANIGASGHHIISQGEADRVLSAHPNERREMIEDALGLKIYQYKKRESEKRLTKTEENIGHVEGLRKEIAPHLRFLKKQAEKVEKSRALRDDLREHYRIYLVTEAAFIEAEGARIATERKEPEARYADLEAALLKAKETLATSKTKDKESGDLLRLEGEQRAVREEKAEISRSLGRVEGEIAALTRRARPPRPPSEGAAVPLVRLKEFGAEIERMAREVQREEDVPKLRAFVVSIRDMFTSLLARESKETSEEDREAESVSDVTDEINTLTKERLVLQEKMNECAKREEALLSEYAALQKRIEAERTEERSAERAIFSLKEEQNALRATLDALESREAAWKRGNGDLEREREEVRALLGADFLNTLSEKGEFTDGMREKQEARRRDLERMKIRLEEAGGGSGEEIMKEFKEVEERDLFLDREIADLHKAADTLRDVIADLEGELSTRFKEGVVKINKEFQNFFSLMFGGGTAVLSVAQPKIRNRKNPNLGLGESDDLILDQDGGGEDLIEEEKEETGVNINVSLPRKRIKGLAMLSGGERALTSIALLFAMSQVNPPPFLILDETDAALDEANSKRYGDMVLNLAHSSELILITHNRETMSRAGLLYGVTMGRNGVSKLLSVSFEEATKVAK